MIWCFMFNVILAKMFPRSAYWHCTKGIFYVIDPCGVAFHYAPYRVERFAKTFFVFDVQIGKMFIVDGGD